MWDFPLRGTPRDQRIALNSTLDFVQAATVNARSTAA